MPMDGNDGSTTLLLHFTGANNSTSIVDSSKSGIATFAVGSTVIANPGPAANQNFPNQSVSFNGAASTYVAVLDNTAIQLTGDYTIDWWQYLNTTAGNQNIFGGKANASSISPQEVLMAPGGAMGFYSSSNASSFDLANNKSLGTASAGAWEHYSINRSGNTYFLTKNGTQTDTFVQAGTPMVTADQWWIGAIIASGSPANMVNGYMQEFRISKGIARWTANFTPPSSPYGNQVYQPNLGRAPVLAQ